jgi:hypothetical protein
VFEWLLKHPLLDVAAQITALAVLFSIGVSVVVGLLFVGLWTCRLWNGRQEFVFREIPRSKSIKAGGAEIEFSQDVAYTISVLQRTVAELRDGINRVSQERGLTNDRT